MAHEITPKIDIGQCGNGWFARIDGQCLFDDPTLRNNPHTKPRKSFPIAEGLESKEKAKDAAVKWVSTQLASLK